MIRNILVVAATLLLSAAPATIVIAGGKNKSGKFELPELKHLLDGAKLFHDKGDFAAADEALEKAIQRAAGAKQKGLEADVALERANNLRAWIDAGTEDTKKHDLLVDSYEIAMKNLDKGARRDVVCNNLGVLYLQSNRPDKAVHAFAEAGEPKADACVFYYNYGRALAQANKPVEALEKFNQSIDKQPRYIYAAEAATKVLLDNPTLPNRLKAARQVLQAYDGDQHNGPQDLLGSVLYEMLPKWGDAEATRPLLPFLASHLARSRVDQERFAELYRTGDKSKPSNDRNTPYRRMGALRRLQEAPGLGDAIEQLARIYQGDFASDVKSPLLSKQDVEKELPIWFAVPPEDREKTEQSLATLLTLAGNSLYQQSLTKKEGTDDARQALRRFTAAYAINPNVPEPALYAVRTLAEHEHTLDKKGEWLDEYAEHLFGSKRALMPNAKTRDDHIHLQSLHTVLATIFEKRVGRGRDAARTASFQWRGAIQDEVNIRRLDPTYPISPDLRFRLADAYIREKVPNSPAGTEYLKAADLYLTLGKPGSASDVLKRVQNLKESGILALNESVAAKAANLQSVAEHTRRARLKGEIPQPSAVRAVALSDSADRLVLGRKDRIVAFDLHSVEPVPVPPAAGYPWNGHGLTWLPRTSQFAFGEKQSIELWDAYRFNKLGQSEIGHDKGVRDVAVAAHGGLFASLSIDGQAKVWLTSSNREVMRVPASRPFPVRVALDADGRILALGGQNFVTSWDVRARKKLRTLETSASVTSVAVSSDGKILAAGMVPGQVQLWDLGSGEKISLLGGDTAPVKEIRFLPRGHLLAVVGNICVRVWDVNNFKEVARFGAPLPPLSVTFSAKGNTMAIGYGRPTGRGLARLWDIAALLD